MTTAGPAASAWCQRWRAGRDTWRHVREGGFQAVRYRAEPVDEPTAKACVTAWHYSATYPAALHRFGMRDVDSGRLVGVAVFSAPASSRVLTGPFPTLEPYQEAVELGRFVLVDDVPANGETWFLARAFAQLRDRGVKGVVSFADPVPRRTVGGRLVMPGHRGAIYIAKGALYANQATPRTLTLLPDGTVFSARAAQKVRAQEQGHEYAEAILVRAGATPRLSGQSPAGWLAEALYQVGARRLRHPGVHRYLFRLGSPREQARIPLGLPTFAPPTEIPV